MTNPSPGTDREIERQRYELSALRELGTSPTQSGARSVRPCLRRPYSAYESAVSAVLADGSKVLEVGSGTGRHSAILYGGRRNVTCSDIAPAALEVVKIRAQGAGLTVNTVVTPMESTPFPNSYFDLVVSAGSLSYADPVELDAEIVRVLKPGGSFVCVDSLNHNPIYRLNRWVHWRFIRDRTRSTLLRMPTIERMGRLGRHFTSWELHGFGAYSWLWAPLSRLIGEPLATKCSDVCDALPGSKRMAFKFVFCAHGLRK